MIGNVRDLSQDSASDVYRVPTEDNEMSSIQAPSPARHKLQLAANTNISV